MNDELERVQKKLDALEQFCSRLAADVARIDNRLTSDRLEQIVETCDALDGRYRELYSAHQTLLDELARIRAELRQAPRSANGRLDRYKAHVIDLSADELEKIGRGLLSD